MTALDLDAIRARAEAYSTCMRSPGSVDPTGLTVRAAQSAEDVPWLVAEVERLRAETLRMHAELGRLRRLGAEIAVCEPRLPAVLPPPLP